MRTTRNKRSCCDCSPGTQSTAEVYRKATEHTAALEGPSEIGHAGTQADGARGLDLEPGVQALAVKRVATRQGAQHGVPLEVFQTDRAASLALAAQTRVRGYRNRLDRLL